MNGMRVRIAVTTLATVLLVACGGLTQSPADGLNFRAPEGWQSTPGIMGRFQLWSNGDGKDKQVLILMKLPPGTKFDKSFDLNEVDGPNAGIEGARIVSRREMTLCGNQASLAVTMRGESSREKVEENVTTVFSKTDDATYMTTYVYPVGASPNARAEAAIYELCRTKSP